MSGSGFFITYVLTVLLLCTFSRGIWVYLARGEVRFKGYNGITNNLRNRRYEALDSYLWMLITFWIWDIDLYIKMKVPCLFCDHVVKTIVPPRVLYGLRVEAV